jgi:hypothetical protein
LTKSSLSFNNLFPSFDLRSLFFYSAAAKASSAFVSTPFENIRGLAQADPQNYKGMFYTAQKLGIKAHLKGLLLMYL